ncbi:cytochrome b [Thorsellia kenyensis]|uniref:Cytochrome b n=1 Tax=Thorsellia kenyensis TaxID=1549888 RepID=A0ABV6CHK0_9GAMM
MLERYKSIQIFMHWMTLFLVIGLYATIYLSDYVSYTTEKTLTTIHFNLGVFVWLFMLIRFIMHFKFQTPAITPPMTKFFRVASKAGHHTLYLLFLIQPIIGVFFRAYDGRSWSFIGMEINPFVPVDEDFSYVLRDVHDTVGLIILGLIALHVTAALFHHYFLKDNTLKRMLPFSDK